MNILKNIAKKLISVWNILGITVVLFILINAFFWLVISIRESHNTIDKKIVATSYTTNGRSDNKINLLLRESWDDQFVYEPYTQFKESPVNNIYDNVTQHGFRSIENQGPWPINPNNINIFVFGGSTTFGYGVANYQNIPSYLQKYLKNKTKNVSVYNFGRGYYYSTQERILYESLLNNGNIPDIVIFIDGLNDFFNNQNIPAMTNKLTHYDKKLNYVVKEAITKLPIIRAFNFTSKKLSSKKAKKIDADIQVSKVLNTYLSNKRMIKAVSKEYNIQPYFVWQPVPFYNSNENHNKYSETWFSYAKEGYNLMNKKRLNKDLGDNFIWLSNSNSNGDKYVDRVHYSPVFSAKIAKSISSFISPYISKVASQK